MKVRGGMNEAFSVEVRIGYTCTDKLDSIEISVPQTKSHQEPLPEFFCTENTKTFTFAWKETRISNIHKHNEQSPEHFEEKLKNTAFHVLKRTVNWQTLRLCSTVIE